jgi:DNA repair ATPase RecN
MASDFTFNEGSIDYSDQGIDPKTGKRIQVKSNIENVKEGKTVLKNPDSMGQMYKNKVNNAGERPEKYAQAQKATKSLKNVKKGYEKQNYKTTPESEKLEKAMKIIDSQPTDVDMTPQKMAETHKKLQDLGYENGLKDVMKDIDSEFKNLKSASKKGIFERMFG